MLEQILNKLSIKEIGSHLLSYSKLFTEPFKSWKSAFALRTSAYDFVVLHIIYYFIFLLLILRDFHIAIFLCLSELLATLLPFFIFLLPFKFTSLVFKKRLKWKQLFRLFIILKLQILPILLLLLETANVTGSEDIYIILENLIWLAWLAFILVYPLLVSLTVIQKIISITINYLALIIFFFCSLYFLPKVDLLGNLNQSLNEFSPSSEFTAYDVKLSNSSYFLQDSLCLLVGNKSNSNTVNYYNLKFVSIELDTLYNRALMNVNIDRIITLDSILCLWDTSWISKRDSLLSLHRNIPLTKGKVDSLCIAQKEKIDLDIALLDTLEKKARFKSNRVYFALMNSFLKDYSMSYTDKSRHNEILKNSSKQPPLKLADSEEYIAIWKVDKSAYYKTKHPYLKIKDDLEKRQKKANFLESILLFPLLNIVCN